MPFGAGQMVASIPIFIVGFFILLFLLKKIISAVPSATSISSRSTISLWSSGDPADLEEDESSPLYTHFCPADTSSSLSLSFSLFLSSSLSFSLSLSLSLSLSFSISFSPYSGHVNLRFTEFQSKEKQKEQIRKEELFHC